MVTTTQSNISIMSTATKKSEKSKKRGNFFKRLLPQVTETEGSIQQLHAIQMII
ncbi:hypothetical protein PIROE2DRAFT_5065 [Piromyces sp. E2]|nr:hypothetical protein PIROE2DRAFT_5065 [Piromyces sp. E2]|eukprot:OUM67531.1 hypothetical protein PIROE2DRAFT_5065 [Piromyces sp. E2]